MEYKDRIEEINQTGEFRAFITVEEDIRKKMNTERELGIEEGIKQGIKKGVKQGIEKGIEQNKREMILNLYALGDSIEKIVQVVKLPIDEVKKIISESSFI